MPSPSTVYTPYENSFLDDHTKPPPPPPKPGAPETGLTSVSLESKSNTPKSIQEQSSNQTRQPEKKWRLHGLACPPQNQDPGERWLPKILEGKSKQQLTEILENQKLLDALANSTFTTHPSISEYQSFLEAALKENTALALHLKEVEAHLIQLRSTNQTQLLATHALERKWRQKQSNMDQALAPFSPPSLYQNLIQAILEEEQISSSLETSFLENDGVAAEREVTDWVRKFRESRKVYYSRLAKKDRWDEGRIGGWR